MAERLRRLLKHAIPPGYRGPVFGAIGSVWYAGSRVACPCCGGRFRDFRLEGRACPRCGSLGRHRLIWLYLERHPQLLVNAEALLHFAPEYCLKRLLSRTEGLRYVTADLDSPLADDHVDIMRLPYREGSFGAVLCSHVLEHIDDDRRAMEEMLRVLRPGGWAIIMAPVERDRDVTFENSGVTDEAQRLRLFGQEDHVRIYGSDLAVRLESTGFSVRVERLVEELPREMIQRMRLHMEGDDEIFFCRKPVSGLTSER